MSVQRIRPAFVRRASCAMVLLATFNLPVAAQESRADITAQAQAEKAKNLHPYEPGRAEQFVRRLTRPQADRPFYPYFDTVYSGGGLTVGAGYQRFYGDRAIWNLQGLISIKAYKLVELTTDSPGHARGRLDLYARTGWRDATQVVFYGTGIDSRNSDRANFRLTQTYATGGLRARPLSWTTFGGALSYEDFSASSGRGPSPSIERVFTAESAPALGASAAYLHVEGSAGIDWRPSPGYARRGGLYEVRYHQYAHDEGSLSFDRVDAEIVQHVPILRETWVLSFRGRVQTTLDDSDTVPYFLMPSLGGGSTLRGYVSWRFRDRHSLLMSAEWRWIPNLFGFDAALFYDAGTVTSRRSDLGFDGMKNNVGIGFRFHGPLSTPLRIELAKGSEGLSLVFSGSAPF